MSANDNQVGGDHYGSNGIQHWDFAWQQEYDQFQYCITKYVDRHKKKNGLQDLYKAQHHLAKYIEVIQEEERKRLDLIEIEEEQSFQDEIILARSRDGV